MAERKMADALDQLYKDGVKMEVQKAKGELSTELDSKLETKAPLNSPALTGTPTAPTPAANDNSTKIATTAYVAQRIQNLINAAPAALDTLGEIATALKNNPNAIQEILTALGNKADKTELEKSFGHKEGMYFTKSTYPSMEDGYEGWFLGGNAGIYCGNPSSGYSGIRYSGGGMGPSKFRWSVFAGKTKNELTSVELDSTALRITGDLYVNGVKIN